MTYSTMQDVITAIKNDPAVLDELDIDVLQKAFEDRKAILNHAANLYSVGLQGLRSFDLTLSCESHWDIHQVTVESTEYVSLGSPAETAPVFRFSAERIPGSASWIIQTTHTRVD